MAQSKDNSRVLVLEPNKEFQLRMPMKKHTNLEVLHFKISKYPTEYSGFAKETVEIIQSLGSTCPRFSTITLELPTETEDLDGAGYALEYIVEGIGEQPISIKLKNFGASELGMINRAKSKIVSLHMLIYELTLEEVALIGNILRNLPKLEELSLNITEDMPPSFLSQILNSVQADCFKNVRIPGWSYTDDDLEPLLEGVVDVSKVDITDSETIPIIEKLKTLGLRNQVPKIIIFTDVERDVDDAVLLVILSYLHKIGVVEILLVVANVTPSEKRAKAAKSILEQTGAPDVPVAQGTDGTDQVVDLNEHEFKFISEPFGAILNSQDAVVNVLQALESQEEDCSMIVVTSHRDLSRLIEKHGALVKKTVSSIFFQGAWEAEDEPRRVKTLVPALRVTNYDYDRTAATHVHEWLRNGIIPTYTATKHSAFEAPIDPRIFRDAADRGNTVAEYLYSAFGEQEYKYYEQANQEDPKKRYRADLGPEWYAYKQPKWVKKFGKALPATFEEIKPYIEMTLYDVVTGLICPLLNYDFFKEIYQPYQQSISLGQKEVKHYIIGRGFNLNDPERKIVYPDINPKLLKGVITELLREALSYGS